MTRTEFATSTKAGPPRTDRPIPWTFHTRLILSLCFVGFVVYPIGCIEGISLLHSTERYLHDQYPAPAEINAQIMAFGQIAGCLDGTLGKIHIHGRAEYLIRRGCIGVSSTILHIILKRLFPEAALPLLLWLPSPLMLSSSPISKWCAGGEDGGVAPSVTLEEVECIMVRS